MSRFFAALCLMISFGISFQGCLTFENPYTKLAPGVWRGSLEIEPKNITPNPKGQPLKEKVDLEFKEVAGGEIPFLLEVKYATPDSFYIEIINGEERILVDNIEFGRDPETARDTMRINFTAYNTYIFVEIDGAVMQGKYVMPDKDFAFIPFIARHGQNQLFASVKKTPIMDLTGKYAATFDVDSNTPYPAIGEFKQNGNHLSGTFLTETGDYRYLDGEIHGEKFYLSTFDGSHAFLFEGKIKDDKSLIGSFRSGKNYQAVWTATRNDNATLGDANLLTRAKNGSKTLDFSITNPDGKTISLKDPAYANAIKIVQVMGSWCPNCMDETKFLKTYLKEHPEQNIAIIALAFERQKTLAEANTHIKTYKKALDIPYEVLYAGEASKTEAMLVLPELDTILSFPTMIVLDKNNEIRHIHTGFSGPATSAFAAFQKEFARWMKELE